MHLLLIGIWSIIEPEWCMKAMPDVLEIKNPHVASNSFIYS